MLKKKTEEKFTQHTKARDSPFTNSSLILLSPKTEIWSNKLYSCCWLCSRYIRAHTHTHKNNIMNPLLLFYGDRHKANHSMMCCLLYFWLDLIDSASSMPAADQLFQKALFHHGDLFHLQQGLTEGREGQRQGLLEICICFQSLSFFPPSHSCWSCVTSWQHKVCSVYVSVARHFQECTRASKARKWQFHQRLYIAALKCTTSVFLMLLKICVSVREGWNKIISVMCHAHTVGAGQYSWPTAQYVSRFLGCGLVSARILYARRIKKLFI